MMTASDDPNDLPDDPDYEDEQLPDEEEKDIDARWDMFYVARSW